MTRSLPSSMRRAAGLACVSATLLLAACGGGGGGGADASRPPSSADYGGVCTPEGQKLFVRSYLDEVYLWYDEIVNLNPANYSSAPDYFRALLVPKDRYSDGSGSYSGFEPTSLAATATAAAGTALKLTAGDSVPEYKTVRSPGGRTAGYVRVDDFLTGAQDQLITAFNYLKAQSGVQDLVLDLRFNGGGYLYSAQAAASMVTAPAAEGRVFERLQFNNKRQAESERNTFYFTNKVQFAERQYPAGTMLPQLSLPRVYVLSSALTCSASESVINSLRGIDVEVIVVGEEATCGKPFGFRARPNCGITYYAVEFQGYNAKGFGDYQAGFTPQCRVTDNETIEPGTANDPLLAGALFHADTNSCPAGTATGAPSKASLLSQGLATGVTAGRSASRPASASQPGVNGRLLLPTATP